MCNVGNNVSFPPSPQIALPRGFQLSKSIVTTRSPTGGQTNTRQTNETLIRANTQGGGVNGPIAIATNQQPIGGAVVPVDENMP